MMSEKGIVGGLIDTKLKASLLSYVERGNNKSLGVERSEKSPPHDKLCNQVGLGDEERKNIDIVQQTKKLILSRKHMDFNLYNFYFTFLKLYLFT